MDLVCFYHYTLFSLIVLAFYLFSIFSSLSLSSLFWLFPFMWNLTYINYTCSVYSLSLSPSKYYTCSPYYKFSKNITSHTKFGHQKTNNQIRSKPKICSKERKLYFLIQTSCCTNFYRFLIFHILKLQFLHFVQMRYAFNTDVGQLTVEWKTLAYGPENIQGLKINWPHHNTGMEVHMSIAIGRGVFILLAEKLPRNFSVLKLARA